ncbi:MAG: hypothetical protein M1821_007494 [Bathelium mastoideum]|nr:MAG: hypothetical protein M1821_007494 [Bathelium mastoideum]
MSQPTAASSAEEIEDELLFTQTLLDSLDPASENYAMERNDFQETIQHLEGLLMAKNAGNGQSLAEYGHSPAWDDQQNSSTSLSGGVPAWDNHVSMPNDHSAPDAAWGGCGNGRLKRPWEPSLSTGQSVPYQNKSRRTTPDACLSTSSSTDSDSMEYTQTSFQNPHRTSFSMPSYSQAIQRRKQAEKEAYDRVTQQRKDNEMARALQEGNRSTSGSGSASGSGIMPSSTWTGTGFRTSNSNDAYGRFSGMGSSAPRVNSLSGLSATSPSSSPASVKADWNTPQSSRYDRPLIHLPSPSNAVATSSGGAPMQSPALKIEPIRSNIISRNNNTAPAEVVDLTGDSGEEDNATAGASNPYSSVQAIGHGNVQYPQLYSVDDPFADLNQHQNHLQGRVLPMAGSNTDSTGGWSQAYNNVANGIQNFGQVVGDLASSLNPFAGQPMGMQTMGNGYSSYASPSGTFNGYGKYGNYPNGPVPNNPFMGDPMEDYSNNPVRHDYDYLYSDPTKTREEINDLLQNISADEDLPPELRGDTPEPMKTTLMPHQLLGLKWLTKMEQGTNRGGILADDMGLGKTIQALALMVTHRSPDKLRKTTLIVAPVALLRQWKREIEEKLKPAHRLSVFIFHGQKSSMTYNRLRQYDVVLTSFGKLGMELKRLQKFEFRKTTDPDARPRKDEEVCLIGEESKWYRVIIDEAQCIKNRTTQVSQAACKLQAKYRICMTGTPMMNNVEELYSLIRFLRIKPYCHWEDFRTDFVKPLKQYYLKDSAMKKLQALLKAILLRRTKTTKIDGQPIIRIPERTVEESHIVFSVDEKQVYDSLEQRSQLTFNRYLRAGTVGKNYSNMLTLLLRLRQCCCHPHLMRDWRVTVEQVSDNPDRMPDLARRLNPNVIQRIKETNGNFECPVCYDAVENPVIFFPCGHDTCLDCFASVSDPSRAIREGDERATARCPECRGPINRSDLLDYKTFRKVHMPESLAEDGEDGKEAAGSDESFDDDSDDSSDDSDEDSGEDVDNRGNLKDFVVEDDEEEAEETEDEQTEAGSSSRPDQSGEKRKPGRPKKDKKGKGKGKAPKTTQTLAELKKLGMRNKKAKQKYLRKLKKDYVSSSKIDQTISILRAIHQNDPREKTIIFSQWTSLLDLLEIAISLDAPELGAFIRYDGAMNANSRNEAVNAFLDRASVKVMLVSLKAGNAGLNLTAASQIILLDPFWNPFIEEQAIDRAHRIGQQRPVRVHKVLVRETVEDRIVALQEKKRELITTALDEGESKKLGRLSTGELAYLFGVSSNPNAR